MKNCLLISFIVFLFTGCTHIDDLFTSYGPEITEVRQVGDFTKITAGEKFDVVLIQDSAKAGTIEMTAGKNVIDGYTSTVHDGELKIRNENKFNWVRKLKIRQKVVVYFKTLSLLQINGSAHFSCKDSIISPSAIEIKHAGLEDVSLKIHGDYIYLFCTNTGGISLTGSCFLISASVDDISFVHTLNLNSTKCYISSYSKDDCYVNGKEELDIRLFGSGNIYYKDNPIPSIKIDNPGTGKAIRL